MIIAELLEELKKYPKQSTVHIVDDHGYLAPGHLLVTDYLSRNTGTINL